MAAKPRKVEFHAYPTVEGREFAFDVDAETFQNLMEREPSIEDAQGGRGGTYRVLPQDLAAAFRDERRVRVKLEVAQL